MYHYTHYKIRLKNSILPHKSITASLLWDRFGIGVSGICAIHCLFFPILISTLPLMSVASFIHDWAHPLFVVMLAPAVYFAARRSHYDKTITLILGVGFLAVLLGWIVGHYWLGFIFETSVTLFGSGMLIAGHWFNYRHHRVCKNHSHNHHPIQEKGRGNR